MNEKRGAKGLLDMVAIWTSEASLCVSRATIRSLLGLKISKKLRKKLLLENFFVYFFTN